MDKIFGRFLENNFAEFVGLTVNASVPVTESLANELIASALLANQELSYCHIRIHPENRVSMEIKSPRWPWPLHLKLRLFGSVDLTRSPTVRAFLENNVLLGKLGSIFNALPPGIRMYEDQVSIDIGAFVKDSQHRRSLELIKSVVIKTEEQKITFDIHIRK